MPSFGVSLCLLFTRLKKTFSVWSSWSNMRLYKYIDTFLNGKFLFMRSFIMLEAKYDIVSFPLKVELCSSGIVVPQNFLMITHMLCCWLGRQKFRLRAETPELQLWLSWILETAYEHSLSLHQNANHCDLTRTFSVVSIGRMSGSNFWVGQLTNNPKLRLYVYLITTQLAHSEKDKLLGRGWTLPWLGCQCSVCFKECGLLDTASHQLSQIAEVICS